MSPESVRQDAQRHGNGARQVTARVVPIAPYVDNLHGFPAVDAGFQFVNAGEANGDVRLDLLIRKLWIVAGISRDRCSVDEPQHHETAGKAGGAGKRGFVIHVLLLG